MFIPPEASPPAGAKRRGHQLELINIFLMPFIEISPSDQEGGIPAPDQHEVNISPGPQHIQAETLPPIFDVQGLIEPEIQILRSETIAPTITIVDTGTGLPVTANLVHDFDIITTSEEGDADTELPIIQNLINDYDIL